MKNRQLYRLAACRLQGDGLRPQRKDTEAEAGNLSAGGRKR